MWIDGLDELDNKILSILKKEARLSYSEIGSRVGLSRVSVKNRMELLEKKGIIQGYVAIICPDRLPNGRRFFLDVITEPEHFEAVAEAIAAEEIIQKLYAVTGESRFRAEGFASDHRKYEEFMKRVRGSLVGVRSFTVQDVQYTIKDLDGVKYEQSREVSKD